MKPTLLLIGERALDLRERLEASGYDTVGWSGKDAVDSIAAGLIPRERVKAVLITRDEVAVVPLLQQRCGAGEQVPLLLEAEADDLEARSQCLKLGANDFWVQDAPPSDLLQRLRLQLALEPNPQSLFDDPVGELSSPPLKLLDLRLEPRQRRAWRGERELQLTEREYALLLLLLEHQGGSVSRQQILEEVWGQSDEGANANVIEVYVRYLRRKLEENGERRLIHTVRGVGYTLRS